MTGRSFPVTEGALAMKLLVSDLLWERLEPLLPPPPERRVRFAWRKPLDYRRVLTGILFVLKTGISWDDLPAELGCGRGKTCRDYLKLWHQAGVWTKLHAVLLAELNGAERCWMVCVTERDIRRRADRTPRFRPAFGAHQAHRGVRPH